MSKKSVAGWMGIIFGAILLISGFATTIPDRELQSISRVGEGTPAYVGGDAYNFIIESSIRGGEIAGARMARAVYISSGVLAIIVGTIVFASELDKKEEPTVSMATEASTIE